LSDTHIDVCKGGHSPEERRAFTDILAHIGDKWTVLVVGVLSLGPMRYSQIFKLVEGVSQRMLTLTLKSLERDGLVTRTVYPTNPPRVDYELTERGKTLICALTLALDVGSGQPHLHSRVPAATSINSAARMGICLIGVTHGSPRSEDFHLRQDRTRRGAPLALLKRRFATTRDYPVEVRVRVGSIASF